MDQAAADKVKQIREYLSKMTKGPWFTETVKADVPSGKWYQVYRRIAKSRDPLFGTERLGGTQWRDDLDGVAKLRTDAEWLLSQLSASEERVREHSPTQAEFVVKPVFTAQRDEDAICFSEYKMVIDGHEHLITYRETAEANARLFTAAPAMLKALRAIATALAEPAGGEYWTARKLADEWGIYNDDLDGERVLLKLAEAAINMPLPSPPQVDIRG